jgi:tRNA pseudouridine13 synthase
LEKTLKTGYPNLYGTQRFGIEQKNWKLGKDIMNGKLNLKQTHEIKFKLQAFASKIFNEYLHSRNK